MVLFENRFSISSYHQINHKIFEVYFGNYEVFLAIRSLKVVAFVNTSCISLLENLNEKAK